VIGDNRAAWNGATWLQVGVLALLSAATVVVLIGVGRAGLPRPAAPALIFSAVLVMAGAHLGLIRRSTPWRGVRCRLLDAAVVTSVGVLVPFALRYHLWWLAGASNADASLGQIVELLLLSAGVIFAVVLSAESIVGRHSESVQSPQGSARAQGPEGDRE
jgi:hypothetical protein